MPDICNIVTGYFGDVIFYKVTKSGLHMVQIFRVLAFRKVTKSGFRMLTFRKATKLHLQQRRNLEKAKQLIVFF
jgi:hypothetical protein